MAAGLFALAAIWRLLYVARLAGSPLGGSLRDDARLYWAWAEHLREVGPLGTHPFFLGPLYPYVLAGIGALGIDSVNGVLGVQACWGAAAVALLADAARRLSGSAIGVVVGLLAAGYQGAVFFDGLILSESLQFLLESLLLWWVVRHHRSAAAWAPAITGGLIGLLAECRATTALLLVPAVVGLGSGAWRSRATLTGAGAMLAGFLLVTVPPALRNHAVSGEWIPFTYNLGLNLYVGHHPNATGGYVAVIDDRSPDPEDAVLRDGGGELDGRAQLQQSRHLALGPSASSAHWAGRAWDHIRAHPAGTLALTLRKLGMLWNRREYPQIENLDGFREVAGPLGWPWLGTFAVLGPLALAGAWWARGPRSPAGFAAAYVVVMSLAIVPFFVTDRYRHHLVPGALVLAGVALEQTRRAFRGHDRRGRGRVAAALLAGVVVVQLPAPAMDTARSTALLGSDLGTRWLERGRADRAVQAFDRALGALGGGAGAGRGVLSAGEEADLFANYGRALRQLGRTAEATVWLERARDRAPARTSILGALGEAYAASGRRAEAESTAARLSRLAGGGAYLALQRGWDAARRGDLEAAEQSFERAVRERPGWMDAWGALIRVQAQRGRLAAAGASLARAEAAGMPRAPRRVYQALLAALGGQGAAAEQALKEVPAEALGRDSTLAEVAQVTRGILARRP